MIHIRTEHSIYPESLLVPCAVVFSAFFFIISYNVRINQPCLIKLFRVYVALVTSGPQALD